MLQSEVCLPEASNGVRDTSPDTKVHRLNSWHLHVDWENVSSRTLPREPAATTAPEQPPVPPAGSALTDASSETSCADVSGSSLGGSLSRLATPVAPSLSSHGSDPRGSEDLNGEDDGSAVELDGSISEASEFVEQPAPGSSPVPLSTESHEDGAVPGAQPSDLPSGSESVVQVVHTCTDGTKIAMTFAERHSVPNQAVHMFNKDARRTVELLCTPDSELCQRSGAFSYDEIATWLLTCGRLSKNQLGDFLGRADEYAVAALDAFVGALSVHLSSFSFDEALRFFLSLFRLPGEAQQIGRIMEKFAAAYDRARPGMFRSTDTAYVLAYSLIMLNVDAHSAQIANKMTMEQFISNNRGIDDGRDLPREMLAGLYTSIVKYEIKIEQREYISAVTEGWLYKQGGRVKTFKKRYIILSGNVLYYYKTPKDREPLGFIPLEDIEVRSLPEMASFKLIPSGNGMMKSVHLGKGARGTTILEKGHHKSFLFRAETMAAMRHWVDSICAHSVESTAPKKQSNLNEAPKRGSNSTEKSTTDR